MTKKALKSTKQAPTLIYCTTRRHVVLNNLYSHHCPDVHIPAGYAAACCTSAAHSLAAWQRPQALAAERASHTLSQEQMLQALSCLSAKIKEHAWMGARRPLVMWPSFHTKAKATDKGAREYGHLTAPCAAATCHTHSAHTHTHTRTHTPLPDVTRTLHAHACIHCYGMSHAPYTRSHAQAHSA